MNKQKNLGDQKGSTLIGAVIVMVALSAIGAALVEINTEDLTASTNEIQGSQANYAAHAILESSFNTLKAGDDPSGTFAFENAAVAVTADTTAGTLSVTAQVGQAKRSIQVKVDPDSGGPVVGFSNQCMTLDVSGAYINGRNLKGIKMIKECNDTATLKEMEVSWSFSECSLNEVAEQNANATIVEEGKITICHVPPGNPENSQTIVVSESGWVNGHNSGTGTHHNMDYLGECAQDQDNQVVECSPDSGIIQIQQISLDDLSGGQDAGDLLFSESADSGEILDVTDRTFIENTDYNFGVTSADDAFYFSGDLPDEGAYTILARFVDNSELEESFVAYDPGEDEPAFDVNSGQVTVGAGYTVQIDVLGSAITCGSEGGEIPVYVQLGVNGDYDDLYQGHDVDGGESYTLTNDVDDTVYTISAQGKKSSCGKFNVTYQSTNVNQVKTLINGQQAPVLAGYGGQQPVQAFLASYLDAAGNVVLADNQIIMLFELGVNMATNPSSPAADFQDLVILMTVN